MLERGMNESGQRGLALRRRPPPGKIGRCIAVFMDPDSEDAEGNSRLIAAAPEMLEALEEARDLLLRFVGGEPGTENARRRIDAAIAKARGGA